MEERDMFFQQPGLEKEVLYKCEKSKKFENLKTSNVLHMQKYKKTQL